MTDDPGRYTALDFNSPLSPTRADRLVQLLAAAAPMRALDLGCGWGELLLRLLHAAPQCHGMGIDQDAELLERGRSNAAARGLADRVEFVSGDAAAPLDPADVVLCIGSDHVYDDQRSALAALHALLRPGGRLVFGSGFWTRPPTDEQAAALGARPDELPDLAALVDLAVSCGFRPLDIGTAGPDEWEAFESGYLSDREQWLVAHPDDPGADEVRAKADRHRNEWLRGYRDVLGFVYLILARPVAAPPQG